MTPTAIIDAALRIAGVDLAPGRNFSDTTSNKIEGLRVLASLMGTYRLQSGQWWEITTNVHTLTPNLNPHTIGTGGDFNQARPTQIVVAYLRYVPSTPDVDIKLTILTVQQYASVAAKAITSQIPQYLFYDDHYSSNTDPKGNVYLWPVPSQANQIVLYTPQIMTNPATLTTDLLLPPGYQRMLEYNMAVEFAALYRKRFNDPRADAVMFQMAKESLYWVKVNNAKPLDFQSDLAAQTPYGGIWDWNLGDWRH